MFERPRSGERAVIAHIDLTGRGDDARLKEFTALSESAGAEVVGLLTASRKSPDPRYFLGKGKVEELAALVAAQQAELVLVDQALSPSQERNLERRLNCRVLDRAGLILDIFAQRARSFEGKLQVELAQLRHLSTRLVRGWTHLERQKGGIGLRGPGETQLETDRRLLGQRIKQLNRRLEKVESQRGQGRRARQRATIPTISLVGYTNAGKSTLFNALTGAEVYARDQLFATLDPTLRRLELPGGAGPVVLADTVGFIGHLPHELVAAFKSTLQETREADLLLHVIDAGDPERVRIAGEVRKVLEEIGADAVPQIEVYNKIDRVEGAEPVIQRDEDGRVIRVWLSAVGGAGLDQLLMALGEHFSTSMEEGYLYLAPDQGRVRAALHALDAVRSERFDADGGSCLFVRLPRVDWEQMQRKMGLTLTLSAGQSSICLAALAAGQ